MDLFGKKKINKLEEKIHLLEVERDGAISLKDITLKKYSDEVEENKRLKIEIENLNKEYSSLFAGTERLKSLTKDKDIFIKKQNKENICMKNRLESIEGLFKDIDGEFIKDFRKARGRALKRSNKRIRNKQLNKMAVSMEKIIKEIME